MSARLKTRGRGRPPLYDWDRLFRRRAFVLLSGIDYACSNESMMAQVRDAASRLRKSVTVRVGKAGDRVEVTVRGDL